MALVGGLSMFVGRVSQADSFVKQKRPLSPPLCYSMNEENFGNAMVIKFGSKSANRQHNIVGSTGVFFNTSKKTGDILESLTKHRASQFNFSSLPIGNLDECADRFYWIYDVAVTSEEHFGCNLNGDAFPGEELFRRYGTFFGAGVFDDHNSDPGQGHWDVNTGHICGLVGDMALIEHAAADHACHIETLMLLDIPMAERVHPGMIAQIDAGIIQDTSMGCYADHTKCSVCGKTISDVNVDPCEHLRGKMQKVRTGALPRGVYERIFIPSFFENTIVTTGAKTQQPGGGADIHAKMTGGFETSAITPLEMSATHYLVKQAKLYTGETQQQVTEICRKYQDTPVSSVMQAWQSGTNHQRGLEFLASVYKQAHTATVFFSGTLALEDRFRIPIKSNDSDYIDPKNFGPNEIGVVPAPEVPNKVLLPDPNWVNTIPAPFHVKE